MSCSCPSLSSFLSWVLSYAVAFYRLALRPNVYFEQFRSCGCFLFSSFALCELLVMAKGLLNESQCGCFLFSSFAICELLVMAKGLLNEYLTEN